MIAAALAKHLAAQGFGTYNEFGLGSTVFPGHEPSTPDALVAVIPTGGDPLMESASLGWDQPTVQLIIRGAVNEARAPYVLARDLYAHLQGLSHVTFDPGGVDEVRVTLARSMQTEPLYLGVDANVRHRYALNLALHARAQTTHRE